MYMSNMGIWETVSIGWQPQPWHNDIILTPQVTQINIIWDKNLINLTIANHKHFFATIDGCKVVIYAVTLFCCPVAFHIWSIVTINWYYQIFIPPAYCVNIVCIYIATIDGLEMGSCAVAIFLLCIKHWLLTCHNHTFPPSNHISTCSINIVLLCPVANLPHVP